MFIRTTSTPNSPRRSVKVVASYRDGFKVRQKIIFHVGIANDDAEIAKLKRMGEEYIVNAKRKLEEHSKQGTLFAVPLEDDLKGIAAAAETATKKGRKPRTDLQDILAPSQVTLDDVTEECRVVEGIHEVAGHVYDDIGFSTLLKTKHDKELLKDLVLARLGCPASKHRTQAILKRQFNKSHDMDRIYRVLDKLHPQIDTLKKITFQKTCSLLPEPVDILLFDVTTLYLESVTTDELRNFGYSKDCRFNTTQLVLALATTKEGLPVGYELFAGNTAEVTTLISCINKWKTTINIENVCFIGDRAMMSRENLSLMEAAGYTYVIAAKLKGLPTKLQKQILDAENYTLKVMGESLVWVGEFTHEGRRLIVSYKQARAHKDREKRKTVLHKIQSKIGDAGPTTRLVSNSAVKQFTTTDAHSQTKLDDEKIAQAAAWDGLHGIITNIPDVENHAVAQAAPETERWQIHEDAAAPAPVLATQEDVAFTVHAMSAIDLIGRYARLWVIEESFRINKHTLSMRPIYHFKPSRIEAHIALCYMAFAVLRHMEYRAKLTQKITIPVILDELMQVQASIYVHKTTGQRYRMPGSVSHMASKIYRAFGLVRKQEPTIVM